MNPFITKEQLEGLDALDTMETWYRFIHVSKSIEEFQGFLKALFGDEVTDTIEYTSAADLWENCHDVLKFLDGRLELLHFREE